MTGFPVWLFTVPVETCLHLCTPGCLLQRVRAATACTVQQLICSFSAVTPLPLCAGDGSVCLRLETTPAAQKGVRSQQPLGKLRQKQVGRNALQVTKLQVTGWHACPCHTHPVHPACAAHAM